MQKHASWKSAAEAGLSPTQGQILTALVQEGALTGSELGARLGVSRNMVKKYLSQGLAFILAFIGTTSLQKGVLWWAAHHRHHQLSGTRRRLCDG